MISINLFCCYEQAFTPENVWRKFTGGGTKKEFGETGNGKPTRFS